MRVRTRPPVEYPRKAPQEAAAPSAPAPPGEQPPLTPKPASAPRQPARQPTEQPPTQKPAKPKPSAAEVEAAEPSIQELLQQAEALASGADKGSVLVADSNASALAATRKMLEDHSYEVFTASDGNEAIAGIRQHNPSLAVLDLKLDKVGGFQVIKQITDQFNPLNKDVWQTPFVMTCNKVTGRDRQYAISLGVKYYLQKPLKPNILCASVEKMLGRYPSAR